VSDELVGRYVLANTGMVEPDEGARAILRRIQDMLLLLSREGLGPGRTPELYVDPGTDSYWEFREFEDGQITLRNVARKYIEDNWPTVDLDHPVPVPRPIRY
jgi:hypothetical protein